MTATPLPTDVPIQTPLAVAPVPTLDYAVAGTTPLGDAAPAMRQLLWLSVLSGLCVGTCWVLLWAKFAWPALVLHVSVYAATLTLAVRAGGRLNRLDAVFPQLRSRTRVAFDTAAGLGLVFIGMAPVFIDFDSANENVGLALVAVAFGLMALTTYRHLLLYRALARGFSPIGYRGLSGSLVALGWVKMIYEGIWLTCCAVPPALVLAEQATPRQNFDDAAVFIAFGALFGCMGFVGVWVAMIAAHARAAVVAGRAERLTD